MKGRFSESREDCGQYRPTAKSSPLKSFAAGLSAGTRFRGCCSGCARVLGNDPYGQRQILSAEPSSSARRSISATTVALFTTNPSLPMRRTGLRGRFVWPQATSGIVSLTRAQLAVGRLSNCGDIALGQALPEAPRGVGVLIDVESPTRRGRKQRCTCWAPSICGKQCD